MARIRIRDSGNTLRTIDGTGSTRIRMRDAGNTLRTITRIRMRDASNVLRTVYDTSGGTAFAASASPTFAFGSTSGSGSATTYATTVTASGGTAPYTYAWSLIAHDHPTAIPTINSPTSATTTFTQTNMHKDAIYTATFRCTVQDSAAHSTTVDVEAQFEDDTSGGWGGGT
jgi:hypothetical protein